jgi:uracil-DNA glycosylase
MRSAAAASGSIFFPLCASTWFKTEPGKTLLARALTLIEHHPAWRTLQ